MWLRGAKGKLAGNSLSKGANGQTIIREIVTPSNPKTYAQCVQRMVFNTASQASALMSEIIDHSFEGVKYGTDSINRFMKLNIDYLRNAALEELQGDGIVRAIYNIKGFNYAQENNYIVSKGSLSFPSYQFIYTDGFGGVAAIHSYTTNLQTMGATTDYKEFLKLLGLQPGDQITILSLEVDPYSQYATQPIADEPMSGIANFKHILNVKRLVFKTKPTVAGPFINLETGRFVEGIIDTKRSDAISDVVLAGVATGLGWHVTEKPGYVQVGMAIIRSKRNAKGKWLRSNAIIATETEEFTSPAQYANLTYGPSQANTLESDYTLDNAISTGDYQETYSQGDIVANPRFNWDSGNWANSMNGPIDSDEAVMYADLVENNPTKFTFEFDSNLEEIRVDPSVVNAGRTITVTKSGYTFQVTVSYTAQAVSFRSETLTIKKSSGTAIYRIFVRKWTEA